MTNEPPPWPRIESPLDGVNHQFHESYDAVRQAAAEASPVLVFIDDQLVVFWRGGRQQFLVTPRLYHAIKAASHSPVALFAILHPLGDQALEPPTVHRLDALRKHTEVSLGALAQDIPHAAALAELQPLLVATLDFITHTVAAGRTSRAAVTAFAGRCGPALLRLTDHATGVQLDALHARVEEVLDAMTQAEKNALQVVVAGPHQARERSVAMQYFRKRLHEPDHFEDRVAYAENTNDEAAALALVGTRRFDHALASAFFGDWRRMQRDLLGDAAAARLAAITFPPDTR